MTIRHARILALSGRGLFSLLVLLGWAAPSFWWLAYGVMPYLHRLHIGTRFLAAAVVTACLVRLWQAVFGPLPAKGSQERPVLFLALAFAVVFAGSWSANLMGILVMGAPGSHYAARFRIVDIGAGGRRSDGVRLTLCDGRGTYELFLDEDDFNYHGWRSGDVIGVAGKSGPFGVLVDEARRLRDDPGLRCQAGLPIEAKPV